MATECTKAAAPAPAPWQQVGEPDRFNRRWIVDADGHGVALVGFTDTDPARDDANARLIAQAPRTLEALKKAIAAMRICGWHLIAQDESDVTATICRDAYVEADDALAAATRAAR